MVAHSRHPTAKSSAPGPNPAEDNSEPGQTHPADVRACGHRDQLFDRGGRRAGGDQRIGEVWYSLADNPDHLVAVANLHRSDELIDVCAKDSLFALVVEPLDQLARVVDGKP